jgi:hypothetical protein
MEKTMFSIICVYNNKKILDEWLLRSLSNQIVNFELITINNTSKEYISASEALNDGGKLAKNEYLMFIHQDIDLKSDNWLETAELALNSLPDLGIAGVAGKTKEGCLSNIDNGDPPIPAGTIQITQTEQVQTLDECLLIIPKTVFNSFQFDEKVCDGWHLYGVDYCLTAQKKGFKVYVLPMNLYHKSTGQSFSKSYFRILQRIQKKWRNDFGIVYTTMGNWKTSIPPYLQKDYYISFFNYACDKFFKDSNPLLWKIFKIPILLMIGFLSKIGEFLGKNKIGFNPYLKEIKLIIRMKKD